MALRSAVGVSDGEDGYIVGARAAQEAITALGDAPIQLVIVFASVAYDQQKLIDGVRSVTGDALLVGTSTAGEITALGSTSRESAAVMLISSTTCTFVAAVGEHISADARAAGKRVADALRTQTPMKLVSCMIFPDSLTGNGADIIRGVEDSLGHGFSIVGGSSADDFRFEKTYQYLNGTVYSDAVVGVGILGQVHVGVGVRHGWLPVGVPRTVTKAEGSVLYEIDGQPAIRMYEDYFGAAEVAQLRRERLAQLAVRYPLGMRTGLDGDVLIRDPLTVRDDGAIVCAAEVPQGVEIQLMLGNQDEAIRVAEDAALDACSYLPEKKPEAVIMFSCISRYKLLGAQTDAEITAVQKIIGKDTPLIGFYTYGEQAPHSGEICAIDACNTVFHNGSIVMCALAEY